MGNWGEDGDSPANAREGLIVYHGVSSRDKQPRVPSFLGKDSKRKRAVLDNLTGFRICMSWLHEANMCHQLRSGVILCSVREERGHICNKGQHCWFRDSSLQKL